MTFEASQGHYLGNYATIVERDEKGHVHPVINIYRGNAPFQGDVGKLAENVASILNGNEPLHKESVGAARVFWSRLKDGFNIRLQQDGVGTSVPGLVFSLATGADPRTGQKVLEQFQDGMVQRKLLDTLTSTLGFAPAPRPAGGNPGLTA